ncbi:hypothetical protein SDC9_109158 [bioreactor metagenome]|uniref:Uncharacterized protein n=1 Tax=bioreactor metagenome TaxID=1076179 RepID=A0A645BAE9_9ZZZZ
MCVEPYRNARFTHDFLACAEDVVGLVRNRENASAALGLERYAGLLNALHQRFVVKMRKCAVQKARVSQNMLKESIPIRNVGHVAAAFSGDIEFFAELLVSLKERDLMPVSCGVCGGNHAGRSATDNENDHVRSSLTASER